MDWNIRVKHVTGPVQRPRFDARHTKQLSEWHSNFLMQIFFLIWCKIADSVCCPLHLYILHFLAGTRHTSPCLYIPLSHSVLHWISASISSLGMLTNINNVQVFFNKNRTYPKLIWTMLNHSNCLFIRAVFSDRIAILIHCLVGVQLY